jgi:5-formyltetrahydrofolate cyclo-ligase
MNFSKPDLRREMRARLRELSGRDEKSRAICEALARHPAYAGARCVALFDAMPVEPHVELLWALAPRRFVYPRVHGDQLVLHEVPALDALHAAPGARYREPQPGAYADVDSAEVDLIVVPGLAFTRDGLRLGRGGGYYDRLLAQLSPRAAKIGVCFEMQIVSELPIEPHDIRLDAVITEEQRQTFRPADG